MDQRSDSVVDPPQDHYLERELHSLIRSDDTLFPFIDQGVLDGIWYWDIEQPDNEWYSPSFCRLFGYDEAEVPHESSWWQERVHPDDLKLALVNLERHRADPDFPYDQVVRYRHRDGSTVWVRCRGLLIRNKDGAPVRMLGAHTDVTELKHAEERARQHLEELAHVTRLSTLGQMATSIAHELNQPLGAIANYAYVAQRTLRDDMSAQAQELRDLLTKLSDQALRAGDIVEHVRELTRKAPAHRSSTRVHELIGEVLDLIDTELRLASVRQSSDVPGSLPAISVDPIQIQQVIFNIVRNALASIAAAALSDGRLDISARVVPGNVIEIAVHNSGPGLRDDDLDHVFDAYFTTKPDGMGMGLTISRSIIEAHGGRMWAENDPEDGGPTFRLTLPIAEDDASPEL